MILKDITYNSKTHNFISDDNIIEINEIPLHESDFIENLFIYGYDLKDISHKQELIKELNVLMSKKKLDGYVFNFISKAVHNMDMSINIASYEFIIYPSITDSILRKFMYRIYQYTAPKFLSMVDLINGNIDDVKTKKLQNTNVLIIDYYQQNNSVLEKCLQVLNEISPNNKKVLFTLLSENYKFL